MFKKLIILFQYLRLAYWDWKRTIADREWEMTQYDTQDPWEPRVNQIVVQDERTKREILEALRYFHDRNIDTGYMAVNTLAHLYQLPEIIQVKNSILDSLSPKDQQEIFS